MKPWAVGLSYFASLFSTISYLAYPGEMIKYGPMILSGILAYPFIFLVVSRFLIPFILRLKITSAYEILETRFGLSVRMLGSTFFLLLRLVWMSVIIYATSKNVLVPLLRINDAATPWVCLALGTLTVIYTSLGGFSAVIWTDVTQTFILIFGAILSIVVISISLGSFTAWWPRTWGADWEQPNSGLIHQLVCRWPRLCFQFLRGMFARPVQIRWQSNVIWPRETSHRRGGCLGFLYAVTPASRLRCRP